MIYGMTARLPWAGDPTPVWKVWDSFGLQDSRMIGYWSSNCPVKTGHKDVLATAYVKEGKILVSIASWAEGKVNCSLKIDWDYLGINPAKVKITAPEVRDFQTSTVFKPGDKIPVEPGKGWLLVITEGE